MITIKTPNDWRALQQETARILSECGFSTEVEKTIETARGKVEIDVYAEETIKGRRYSILCECKHWKAKVPQQVIHGFRTVIADSGANLGYIVSSAGFQSGALSAAELTNVRLMTWEEFQAEYEESWLEHYLLPTVADRCDLLLTYTEPLLPQEFELLTELERAHFLALKNRHDLFGHIMMMFTPYARMVVIEEIPKLPLRERLALTENHIDKIPAAILDATSYREFLEAALKHSYYVIAQFQAVLSRVRPNVNS